MRYYTIAAVVLVGLLVVTAYPVPDEGEAEAPSSGWDWGAAFRNTKNALAEKSKQLAESVQKGAESLKEKVTPALQQASQKVNEGAEKLKPTLNSWKDSFYGFTKGFGSQSAAEPEQE